MKRPNQHEYFMAIARVAATRSNCYKRQVGCVIVDVKNRILSTGYNGVPSGVPHCKPGECPRDKSGENLDLCLATHAEMNALIQCKDTDKINAIYVTASPCLPCTIVLLNTPCEVIIFDEAYPGNGLAEKVWTKQGRWWSTHEETKNETPQDGATCKVSRAQWNECRKCAESIKV